MSIKTAIKIFALILITLMLFFLHNWIKNYYLEQQVNQQSVRVENYRNTLEAALGRYDYLPFVLSQNEQIFRLAFSQPQQASQLLESIKDNSQVDAIYIMDLEGNTISSSNWNKENSFVGKNYGYRPYFKQALSFQKGQFFGVGATTSIPGYFVSAPFIENGKVSAVIVVKVLLSSIEDNWNDRSVDDEIVFATDENNVIILSSQQKWLYYTLQDLDPKQIIAIKEQKQFGANPQIKLNIKARKDSPQLVTIDKQNYTQSLSDTGIKDWKIHYLISYARINDQLLIFWSRVLILLLIGLATYLMFRSVNNRIALKQSRGESLSLRQLNTTLQHEIEERKQIEKQLREAQVELRRTSKLAAMGQLSASITHELGQPLSAMRTYIASMKVSQKENKDDSYSISTLGKLDKLVDRMTTTSQQLRYFARSGEKETRPLDLRKVISGAINTTQPSLQELNISLTVMGVGEEPVMVTAGRIRLEQVLVNVIKNAMEALQDSVSNEEKWIKLTLKQTDSQANIEIEDNGPGVSEEVQKQLFEPFFTTKASGVGMGLGLAISLNIVSELEGSLNVENRKEGGARFIIALPLLKNE